MDPMAYLRLSSILTPDQIGMLSSDDPYQINQFQPQTKQLDSLEALLNNYPQRQKPSFMQRLAAGLEGAAVGLDNGAGAGIKTTQSALNQPFDQAVQDWQNKVKVQQQLATDENLSNNMQRQLYATELANNQKNKELEIKNQYETGLLDAANKRIANTAALNQIKEQTALGGTPVWGKDGTLYMQYKDGTVKQATMQDGSPITAQLVSPSDLETMKENATKERAQIIAEAAGERNAASIAARQTQGKHISRMFQAPDGQIYAVYSDGTSGPMDELPLGTTSVAAPPTNTTTTTTTPPGFLGSLLGNKPKVTKQTESIKQVGSADVSGYNKSNNDQQKVVVKDKNGKLYSLPKSQLDQAIKQGYVLVQ